jgi:hypothetical protein
MKIVWWPKLLETFKFFRDNAGYVVGRRAEGAYHLAVAEWKAEKRSWTFEWRPDDDGDLGDHEYWCANARRRANGPKAGRTHSCEHFIEYAVLKDSGGVVRASLGGIIDADHKYQRVVEAELALEALAEENIEQTRDAQATNMFAL